MFSLFCAISVFISASIGVSAQLNCLTPERNPGQCISIYSCPPVVAQFQGPISPQTTQYLRSLQCVNGIGRYPHVCCAGQAPISPQPTNVGPSVTRLTPFNLNAGVSQTASGHIIPQYGSCGLTSLAQRIFGGEETQLDDFPWMALFEYSKRNRRERKLSCGGSLINTRYILTAAHCLVGEIETRVGELVGVRLGEYDITKDVDCIGYYCADPVLLMGVDEKIPHELYNERSKNRENDIGLVRMSGEVRYSDYIKPICLPSSVNSRGAIPNEKLVSAGWGRTLQTRQSSTKLSVDLPAVNQQSCTNRYRVVGIEIGDSQLCAGGVYGKDTCDGDSGNPLMRIISNVWVVEGIVSFGRGCGQAGWPAVYTRVASFDQWIRYKLRP